jgi:hypothetical protein
MRTSRSFLSLVLSFGISVSANARMIDNGDGTITDTGTNLMWLKDGNLAGAKTWNDALTWAGTLFYAGMVIGACPQRTLPAESPTTVRPVT